MQRDVHKQVCRSEGARDVSAEAGEEDIPG